jgi:hypothetical protein
MLCVHWELPAKFCFFLSQVSSLGEDMWKEIYFHLNLKEEEQAVHEDYLLYWKLCHKIAKTKKASHN